MRFLTLVAGLILLGTLSFGETFTGKLVDANCAMKNQKTNPATGEAARAADCSASAATRTFAVETADGRVLKLDSAGNSKAKAMMKDNYKPDAQVTVNGELSGQTVKVDSLDSK